MKLLRYPELKEKKGVPYTRMHIDRLERAEPPRFPRRVHLGPGTIAWVEEEIDQYLLAKLAERAA